MSRRELLTVGLILLALDAITISVFWGIAQNEMQVPEKKIVRSYGPKIPKCDKPLWERITDGC